MALPSTFRVIDHRTPGQPLQAITVKLPPQELAALDALAKQLGHSRGALTRALLIEGCRSLEQAQEVA